MYSIVSKYYDLLDIIYFREKGKNPRTIIMERIPNKKIKILDMCCGTLSNTIDIAKTKPQIEVMAIDLSKSMLHMAKAKIEKYRINNVFLERKDATKTNLPDKSFEYIIIGLVLHESSPEFTKAILDEAYRLLKDDGQLIILEWDRPKKYVQLVKFAPMYLLEKLNCHTFKSFYNAKKDNYFLDYGFKVDEIEYCNYSIVLNLKKV